MDETSLEPEPSTLRAYFCGWTSPGAQVIHSAGCNIKPRKVVSLRHHRRPVSDFNAQIVNCSASVNLYQDRSSPDPPTHGFGEPISRRVSALQFSNSSHASFPETTANQHFKFCGRVRIVYRPEKSLPKKVTNYGSEMLSGDAACPRKDVA